MSIGHYATLTVFQQAMALVVEVYRVTNTLPPLERFGLTQQLRRAAVSVPSNIAEGHSRRSRRDYLRFIGMALGSLAEVETQILIATRLSYLPVDSSQTVQDLIDQTARLLRGVEQGLIRRIHQSDSR